MLPTGSIYPVYSTPSALENAYRLSKYAQDSDDALEKYKVAMATDKADQEAFRQSVADDKKKGVSQKSPYTLGFTGQVRALAVRQFQQRLQDKFQLYTSYTLTIVLGLVLGGAFFALPTTSAGAFTRGGLLFAAVRMNI